MKPNSPAQSALSGESARELDLPDTLRIAAQSVPHDVFELPSAHKKRQLTVVSLSVTKVPVKGSWIVVNIG
jgi:hypothetical protein